MEIVRIVCFVNHLGKKKIHQLIKSILMSSYIMLTEDIGKFAVFLFDSLIAYSLQISHGVLVLTNMIRLYSFLEQSNPGIVAMIRLMPYTIQLLVI